MINGLPEKLKKLRIDLELSQRTVANFLNVSPSIISGYETGERTPSVENLLALSSLYRCSTDYLLGKDSSLPGQSICVQGLTAKQVHLIAELVNTMR